MQFSMGLVCGGPFQLFEQDKRISLITGVQDCTSSSGATWYVWICMAYFPPLKDGISDMIHHSAEGFAASRVKRVVLV